jgi:hypothetical protein
MPPGRNTSSSLEEIKSYLEVAKARKPTVADYEAAVRTFWNQNLFEDPPQGVLDSLKDADTPSEVRDAFQVAVIEAIKDPAQAQIVAQGIEAIAKQRAEVRLTVLDEMFGGSVENTLRALDKSTEEIDADPELARLRDLILRQSYGGGKPKGMSDEEWLRKVIVQRAYGGELETEGTEPSTPKLRLEAVEAAITKRVDELMVDPDSIASGITDKLIGDAPPSPEPRALPYIGNLPAPDTITPGSDEPVYTPPGIPAGSMPYETFGSFPEAEFLQGSQPGGVPSHLLNRREEAAIQRYHLGDDFMPIGWDPTQIVTLKNRLITAGYLDPDYTSINGSTRGSWGEAEATAYGTLLWESNRAGVTWDTQLQTIEADPSAIALKKAKGAAATTGTTRSPFVAPSYLAPDMDLLKQAVKDSVRGRLGREPTSAEMSQLIAGLDTDYRSAYDVQVQASRSEYDATTAAIDTETAQSGGTFRSVDPASSFAERFESYFGNELAFKKRREDLNERQSYTDATMRMIDSIGGGG